MRKALTALVLRRRRSRPAAAPRSAASRNAPDEFAVARNAPLIIPPDFTLTPPVAGTAGLSAGDAQQQAIDALFGGPAPRSAAETSLLDARRPRPRRRSASARPRGTPTRAIVDKGPTTLTILAAPAANSNVASAQAGSKREQGERIRRWPKRHFPPASSRSNRCSTGRAAASRKARGWSRKRTSCSADIQQALIGQPAQRYRPRTARKPRRGCSQSLKASGGEMPETLCGGRLAVDQVQRLIRIDGHPIGITEMEYRVLELLAFARNNVVTRAMLLKHLYRRVRRPAAAQDHRRVHLQAAQEAAQCVAAGRSSSRRSRSAAGSCATSTRPAGLNASSDSPIC